MKIKEINRCGIFFDNGNAITYGYDPECYEDNYPDFLQLEHTGIEDEEFSEDLEFEELESGFRFGSWGNMFYVPCYSYQNGYYSNCLDIFYNGKKVFVIAGEIVEEY